MPNGPYSILVVEDSPADANILRQFLLDYDPGSSVTVVTDGEQAMGYLRREAPFTGSATPHLIFLDLNLPRMDGREVLRAAKSDAALRGIPIVVMTTSSSEHDISECYGLHASGYVVKPFDIDEFLVTMRRVCDYWYAAVALPNAT